MIAAPAIAAPAKAPPERFTRNGVPSLHVLMPISKTHPISQLCREKMITQGALQSARFGDRYSNVANRAIHDARNELVKDFMKSGCDCALWIDDDMVFDPEHVHWMRQLAAELPVEVGIFSAIIVDRQDLERICAYRLNPVSKHYDRIRYGTFPDDEPFDVDGCGMAFTIVRRWVYESMPPIEGGWYWFEHRLSEDLAFCARAQSELGCRVVIDPRCRVGHMGEVVCKYESERQRLLRQAGAHILDEIEMQQAEAQGGRDPKLFEALDRLRNVFKPLVLPTEVVRTKTTAGVM